MGTFLVGLQSVGVEPSVGANIQQRKPASANWITLGCLSLLAVHSIKGRSDGGNSKSTPFVCWEEHMLGNVL